MNENWILVTDRLPEALNESGRELLYSKNVLMYDEKTNRYTIAHYDYEVKKWFSGIEFHNQVTHWQPLLPPLNIT